MSKTQIVATLESNVKIPKERSLIPMMATGDRAVIEPMQMDEFLDEKKKIKKAQTYEEPYLKGRIIAIGGGEYGTTIPDCLKPGVVVNYWQRQAMDFILKIDGEKKVYHLIRASDIWLIL